MSDETFFARSARTIFSTFYRTLQKVSVVSTLNSTLQRHNRPNGSTRVVLFIFETLTIMIMDSEEAVMNATHPPQNGSATGVYKYSTYLYVQHWLTAQ